MPRDFARHLRNNMTDAERQLWQELRGRQLGGWKFRRQAQIGEYIVDFVCFENKIIIELDGSQHFDRREYDRQRTDWLVSQGFQVLRYWNHQIFEELDDVLQWIWTALRATPHPNPPPQGGREPESPRTRPSPQDARGPEQC